MRAQERDKTRCAIPQPFVYVVILNWNLKDDSEECVASVLRSDYPSYRVVIVDNGSTDGSPEYLTRHFPEIQVIANPTNVGFAAGNNIGIRYALQRHADYVFLLNNDTTVAPCMLGKLVHYAEGSTSIGVVAPKVLYYKQRDRIWRMGERIYRWLPVPLSIGRDETDRGQFKEPFDVDYVAFCGVLIKRVVFETVGLLDECFFFTYEDADFCRRTRNAGFRIVCVPQAHIWHKVSLSAERDAANMRYLKSKSRAIFYRMYPHGPHPWLTAAYLWLNTLGTALVSLLHGQPELAKMAVRGLSDGYRVNLDDWKAHGEH